MTFADVVTVAEVVTVPSRFDGAAQVNKYVTELLLGRFNVSPGAPDPDAVLPLAPPDAKDV
jgi:hypothetical protein